MTEYQARKREADRVLAALPRNPAALDLLARGLRFSDGLLSELRGALHYRADELRDGHASPLPRLALSRALLLMALDSRCPSLLARLERVDEEPWAALRSALEELRHPTTLAREE